MDYICSIKTQYLEKILQGTKRFEIRVRIPKEFEPGCCLNVYEPKPIGVITAVLYTGWCLKIEPPIAAWNLYHPYLGVTWEEFYEYTKNRNVIYLIEIEKAIKLRRPRLLEEVGLTSAPQWFTRLK